MAIYLADQFAELTKFDPVLDRMVTWAGRLILAVRADSLEAAYQTALKDAKGTERRYLSMAADAFQVPGGGTRHAGIFGG